MKQASVWMSIKKFHFNSLLFRNTLCIALAIVLPMGIIAFVNHYDYRQEIYKQMMLSNEGVLEKCVSLGDSLLDDLAMAADELAVSNEAALFLRKTGQYGADFRLNRDYEELCNHLMVQFQRYKQSFQCISHLFLYASKTRTVLSDTGLFSADRIDDAWTHFPEIIDDDRTYYLNSRKDERIILYRPMHTQQEKKTEFVVIEIDLRQLGETISQNRSQNRSTLLLLDHGGRTIYRGEDPEGLVERVPVQDLMHTEDGHSRILPNSGTIFSVMETEHRCFTYALVTQQHFFTEEEARYRHFLTLTIVLLAVGSVLAIAVITIFTYYPMRRILDVIRHPYDPNTDPTVGKKENELLYITSSIINVMEENDQTARELRGRMQAFNEAQARALQFQTNPHFLSNALEIIKWSSVSESGFGNPTSVMLTKLAELYRNLIRDENVLVPLREELEYVRLYIEILTTRYEDKITFGFAIDPKTETCFVLKASIQPLVENAIKHGLSARHYIGSITVRTGMESNSLYIDVKNDGEYVSPGVVERINDSLEQEFTSAGSGIGLHNINTRIKLIFGKKYGVRLRSNGDAGGVTARIEVPVIDGTNETER